MELWDLVDEKGNKVGKVINRGEIQPEGTYHVGVDVWIINSENKILLQKRSSKKRYDPSVWAMTGGSSFYGEIPVETIIRETKEELGVYLQKDNLRLVKKYAVGRVFLYVYLIRQDVDISEVVIQAEELSDVKWFSFEEAEEIYSKGQFMKNRWEYIRDIIKSELEK